MKKKLLTSILCVAMSATMLAGCGSDKKEDTTAKEPVASQQESQTESATTEAGEDEVAVTPVDFTQTLTAKDDSLATVGLEDCTTAWWGDHSQTWQVEKGGSKKVEFDLKTAGTNNWDGFVVVLQNVADAHSANLDEVKLPDTYTGDKDKYENPEYIEYAVVRQDNYGWGDGYSAEDLATTWDWPTMMSEVYGSHVTVEVKFEESKDTKWAEVYMTFKCLSGKEFTQEYTFETVSGEELHFCLGLDHGYIYNLKEVQ